MLSNAKTRVERREHTCFTSVLRTAKHITMLRIVIAAPNVTDPRPAMEGDSSGRIAPAVPPASQKNVKKGP